MTIDFDYQWVGESSYANAHQRVPLINTIYLCWAEEWAMCLLFREGVFTEIRAAMARLWSPAMSHVQVWSRLRLVGDTWTGGGWNVAVAGAIYI